MTDKKTKEIYLACFESLGLLPIEFARIMHLNNERSRAQATKVYRKLSEESTVGVTYAECLALQLLKFVADEGYDLATMTFHDDGSLKSIVNKKNKRCQFEAITDIGSEN